MSFPTLQCYPADFYGQRAKGHRPATVSQFGHHIAMLFFDKDDVS